jgi:hypothetical protein
MAVNFNGCLTINGVAVAPPTKYDPKLSAIDASSSGRNDAGIMTREVVRRNVANISVGWDMLTNAEFETLMSVLDNDEFTVNFYMGTYKTANMYHGDLSISMVCVPKENDVRWNISCTLIEY